MSELPEIDDKKVIKRYQESLSNVQHLVFQLEVLAEALRDERDESTNRANDLDNIIVSLKEQIAPTVTPDLVQNQAGGE